MYFLYVYLLTIPVFFIIDLLWIGLVANNFYNSQIGHLRGDINWPGAVTFYLIYIVGIVIFAVLPALDAGSWQKALLWGALFGFFTYATYDLTNYATLKDWPLLMVIVDMAWGTILSGSVAAGGYFLAKTFLF